MKPEYIILHHSLTKDSGTVSWQAIRRYHVDTLKWRDIGYHFGIELVNGHYEVLMGRALNETGAHCKENNMNYQSLGICFVGNFDEKRPDDRLWETGIRLVSGLCTAFSISTHNIRGHRDFATYKTCPGTMFDIKGFRQKVLNKITTGG